MLQFTKVINVFYLGNAILQSFPSVSTNDPLYTIVPLTILILLGVLKEGLADYKRYKIDKITNALPVNRITGRLTAELESNHTPNHGEVSGRSGIDFSSPSPLATIKNSNNKVGVAIIEKDEFVDPRMYYHYVTEMCRTEDLVVGDIIRVDDDHPVPADCLLLASEKNKQV